MGRSHWLILAFLITLHTEAMKAARLLLLLFLLPSTLMAGSSGDTNPTTTADRSGAPSSPSSAFASDNNDSNFQNNEILDLTGFGFSIPPSATIDGVEVKIEWANNTDSHVKAQLIDKDGSLTGSQQTGADYDSGTDTTHSFGSSSTQLGASVTATDVNDANFGVAVEWEYVTGSGGSRGNIDHVTVGIYYTDLNQKYFIIRNDDGSETAATDAAAENTGHTGLVKNTNIRLRFSLESAGTYSNFNYRLEVSGPNESCVTATYAAVPTASGGHWIMSNTSQYTDGTASTDAAGVLTDSSGTFVAGELNDTANDSGNISLTDGDFSEIEYSVQATDNAAGLANYCFRLTNAGTATAFSYSVYAQIAIEAVDMEQLHTRIRKDDGSQAAATWHASEDDVFGMVNKNTPIRMRFTVKSGATTTPEFRLEVSGANETCSTGTYGIVSTAAGGHWQVTDSTNVTNGGVTTEQLTNEGTFVAGEIMDTGNQTGVINLDSGETTEVEYTVQAWFYRGRCLLLSRNGCWLVGRHFVFQVFALAHI